MATQIRTLNWQPILTSLVSLCPCLNFFFSYPQLITLVCSEGPIHQNSCRNVVWPHLHARCCNTLRERLQGRFAGVYFPGNLGKASIKCVLSCYDWITNFSPTVFTYSAPRMAHHWKRPGVLEITTRPTSGTDSELVKAWSWICSIASARVRSTPFISRSLSTLSVAGEGCLGPKAGTRMGWALGVATNNIF